MKAVEIVPTFEGWQAAARALLRDGVSPAAVTWREVSATPAIDAPPAGSARVPREFLDLARQAAQASDPARWTALYAVLFRAPKTIATLHPSAVLRGQDDAEQARLYAMLLADVRLIAAVQRGSP